MDGFAGAIGISDSKGKGSPVLNACSVRTGYNKEYIMWYLRYLAYQDVFMSASTGIRARSCDLSWTKIANLSFIIPPYEEQCKAVERVVEISKLFTLIEQLSAIKTQKKELFKEYKKVLIAELMTGERMV